MIYSHDKKITDINMIGTHDRQIIDIEYPKQIKNLIIYHVSVYKYMSMPNVKFMSLIYAYKKKSETDLDNAREGEHLTLTYY